MKGYLEALKDCGTAGMGDRLHTPDAPPSLYSLNLRVYASFHCRNGWHVSFLEANLKKALRKHLTFASKQKFVEPALRENADLNLENRAAIQHGNGIDGVGST